MVSSDSSYTLELLRTRNGALPQSSAQLRDTAGDWREQLQRNYLVKRGEGAGGGGGSEGGKRRREKEVNRNSIQLLPLGHSHAGVTSTHAPVPTKREEEERKELIAALVKERAKSDGIRDLIGQCYNCAAVGPWSKLRRRSLSSLCVF